MKTTVPCCFCHIQRDPYRMAIFYADCVTICAECVELFHDSLASLASLPQRETAVMATVGWPCGSFGEEVMSDLEQYGTQLLRSCAERLSAGITTGPDWPNSDAELTRLQGAKLLHEAAAELEAQDAAILLAMRALESRWSTYGRANDEEVAAIKALRSTRAVKARIRVKAEKG